MLGLFQDINLLKRMEAVGMFPSDGCWSQEIELYILLRYCVETSTVLPLSGVSSGLTGIKPHDPLLRPFLTPLIAHDHTQLPANSMSFILSPRPSTLNLLMLVSQAGAHMRHAIIAVDEGRNMVSVSSM